MRVEIRHRTLEATSFRGARIRSLFNAEEAAAFDLDADLPLETFGPWQVGAVVGPSGSGKTSLGRVLFGPGALHQGYQWHADRPICDDIAPAQDHDAVCAALTAVGLGDVPAWLRPYAVLSTGQQFRAELARLVLEHPGPVVVDEFTSTVDRQVAKVGAYAFAKAWRKTPGRRVVVLSCHLDILDWLAPDWVYRTDTGEFQSGRGLRRPDIRVDIEETNWSAWPRFEPHHYLKLPMMVAAKNFVGWVDGSPVCHVAVSTRPGLREARACRLVVMPDWQGAGVGLAFLNEICRRYLAGLNCYGRALPMLFHTSHPGLVRVLRRAPEWVQVSCILYGVSKRRSAGSLQRSRLLRWRFANGASGFGGHFRAVQGFRYLGRWASCSST